ncbi:unnamed protein product [Brugia timori]|uniref:Phage protein n=1 Tax=Brugia timori TaxID=42155 RepID=A0A0R3RCZ0_9BILA|nr:unnamed protein product [Brugia timori]
MKQTFHKSDSTGRFVSYRSPFFAVNSVLVCVSDMKDPSPYEISESSHISDLVDRLTPLRSLVFAVCSDLA